MGRIPRRADRAERTGPFGAAWLALWGLIGLGIAGRLAVAFATTGAEYDLESFARVARLLGSDPLDLYSALTPPRDEGTRWPYPSAYFPWVLAADRIASAGLPFHGVFALPAIAADAAIAWLVQDHLGRNGASQRVRLGAVALVALGPVFALTSGFHSQFDAVAFLPAVLALWLWERTPNERRRIVVCGLLIGAGAALKTVPLILLLALLPRCRNLREGALLTAAAVAVPLACLAPWLVRDAAAVADALGYVGIPGCGGLTLALHPAGAAFWVTTGPAPWEGPNLWVIEHRFAINLVVGLGLALLLARARPPAVTGAVLLMLGIYAFATGFFFHYLVWGMPFMLMAGHLRAVGIVQTLALVPALLFYGAPWSAGETVTVYATLMIALWAGLLVWFVAMSRRVLLGRSP